MRLESILFRNYKSIKHLQMEMRGLTCLVGPNNSGKSNLIDAFAFMRDVAQKGLAKAVETRDANRIRYYGAPDSEPVSFEISISESQRHPTDHSGFLYSLKLTPDCTAVAEERIERVNEGTKVSVFSATMKDDIVTIDFAQNRTTTGRSNSSPAFEWYAHRVPEAARVKNFLSSLQFYRFVPDLLKRPGPAQMVDRLERDGQNFSSYVHAVQVSYKKQFARIETELRKNFPDIEELATHLTPAGTTEVMIQERWFDRMAYGSQLSDGLMGFLAHLFALYGPDDPPLVVFEEPENYIHPRLMQRLVDMLKGAAESRQVVLSTHSVQLINQLELGDLLVIERDREGATTGRRIEARKALEDALREWALGDAYISGVLDAA